MGGASGSIASELKGKHIVLDLWAQDATGQPFDIEMQTSKHSGWNARSVYYMARALGEQLKEGEGYDHIQPVIGIHLMDFELFPEPDQALWEFTRGNPAPCLSGRTSCVTLEQVFNPH